VFLKGDLIMQFRSQSESESRLVFGWDRNQVMVVCAMLALLTLALRFAPLPENFSAFGAFAMFCGIFATRSARWWMPLAVLFVADCIGHFSGIAGMGFYNPLAMLLNYVGFASMSLVGMAFAKLSAQSRGRVLLALPVATIVGSACFFLISNFGAWLDPRMQYPQSLSGLLECYFAGLPFWRATLQSDLVFTMGFTALAMVLVPVLGKGLFARKTA
jgi:hypothetical protein